MGIADGVGGWAEVGIDAGMYARGLMANADEAVEEALKGAVSGSNGNNGGPVELSAQDVLQVAYDRTAEILGMCGERGGERHEGEEE